LIIIFLFCFSFFFFFFLMVEGFREKKKERNIISL
jgi:hypothetical protein